MKRILNILTFLLIMTGYAVHGQKSISQFYPCDQKELSKKTHVISKIKWHFKEWNIFARYCPLITDSLTKTGLYMFYIVSTNHTTDNFFTVEDNKVKIITKKDNKKTKAIRKFLAKNNYPENTIAKILKIIEDTIKWNNDPSNFGVF